jgi:3',5'-cyclic AMP phosphodiesterase CpdA
MHSLNQRHPLWIACLGLILTAIGCGELPDREHDRPEPWEEPNVDCPDGGAAPYQVATVIVLPDTQYYAGSYPAIFEAQTQWIRDQAPIRSIQAVLHVGDVVDTIQDHSQWKIAEKAMRRLDGVVPYVLVPGNHDQDGSRSGLMSQYFSPATMPWITGTMVEGEMENNYAILAIGPQNWLVIGLEFGPRDQVLAWADGILKAYPMLPAILVTHAYLYSDGTRYDWQTKGESQVYNPHWYGYTAPEGINDGEEMWRKLIEPNPNVRLVFSGHMNASPYALAHRSDTRHTGGLPVHQLLQDFQSNTNGGDGYLCILEFDYPQEIIRVRTYSPTLKAYITDKVGHFSLSLDL